MILLIILTTLVCAYWEAFRDAKLGNTKHWNRFLLRLIVPCLVGLITLNFWAGAFSYVLFYLGFDPTLNLLRGKKFFHTSTGTWKQVLSGEKSFYDALDGRVALMIELFVTIVCFFQMLDTL